MFLLPTAWWALLLRRDAARRRLRVGRARRLRPRRALGCSAARIARSAASRSIAARGRRDHGAAVELGGLRARAASSGCSSRRPGSPARWPFAAPLAAARRAGSCSCRPGSRSRGCRPIPRACCVLLGIVWIADTRGLCRRTPLGSAQARAARSARARPGKAWPAPSAAVAVYYVVLSAVGAGAIVDGRMARACSFSPACWR